MRLSNNSPYVIIIYYRPFISGKFLSNILSFNKNFIAQLPHVGTFEYSIQQIMKTLPPTKEDCKQWVSYELGCTAFWGFNADDLIKDQTVTENIHKKCIDLLLDKKYCFFIAHGLQEYRAAKNYFTNATTIELINDTKIHKISSLLKGNSQIFPVDTPLDYSIKFNIDSMFNKNEFFANINELLLKFNIEDKTLDYRVFEYYNRYMDLHK